MKVSELIFILDTQFDQDAKVFCHTGLYGDRVEVTKVTMEKNEGSDECGVLIE